MILSMTNGATTTLSPAPQISESSEPGWKKPEKSQKLVLSFGIAATIFLALNVIPQVFPPKESPFNKFDHPCKGSVWYLVDDMRKTSGQKVDYALLGSSLMVAAITNADATGENKQVDLTTYHKASYLDKKLNRGTNSVNLAVAGEMPSDAFLILNASIEKLKPGSTLIYGLAPRDFIDHDFKSPTDSEAYQLLHRIVPMEPGLSDKYNVSIWEKMNYWIEKSLFLSDNAIDIQSIMSKWGDTAIDTMFGKQTLSDYAVGTRFWDRQKLIPSYKMTERIPNAFILEPEDLTKPPIYVDNTMEYVMRYRRPDMKAFANQAYFVQKIGELCKERNIKLMLVNMPITETNQNILPPALYQTYMSKMKELATANGARFIDFNIHSEFPKTDFNDGVHMNARGAIKFVDKLATIL